MDFIAVQLLTGLAGASSLFLVSAGLTVIFGVTRVVNFAHGSLCMLGAYIGWTMLTQLPREPQWFALGLIATGCATALIGVALETTLLRRIYRAPELFQLLATFGVVLIVQDATLAIWGPSDLTIPRPRWLRSAVDVFGQRFPAYDLFRIALGPVVLAALFLLFRRTRWGILVRAATQDREMVAALGVNQSWLFTSVFALGAGLAGLAGAVSLPDSSANLQIDLSVITDAFVVVVVGGLGSLTGAYVASLLIAILQAFGIVLLPKVTLVLVFLVMAAVLIVRPNGLLGRSIATARTGGTSLAVLRPASLLMRCGAAAVVAVAWAAPLFASPYVLALLTDAFIAVLFAASLHLMMGPGGMPSFGHAAWFGIGAYAAGLAATRVGLPLQWGLLAAPLAAGGLAAAFGGFVVRLSGVYLAMLTLAFAQIVWAVMFQWGDLTGGDNGILGVWPQGWAREPRAFYSLTLVVCLGGTTLLRRLIFSPFGYSLRATRDSAPRAMSIGLSPSHFRLATFAIAAAAAGLSGALFAYAHGSVFPTYVSIPRSVDALLMVLLGGVQTVTGPIIGALSYTALYTVLLRATDLWRLGLGVAIVVLVLAFPDGIAGAFARRRDA